MFIQPNHDACYGEKLSMEMILAGIGKDEARQNGAIDIEVSSDRIAKDRVKSLVR